MAEEMHKNLGKDGTSRRNFLRGVAGGIAAAAIGTSEAKAYDGQEKVEKLQEKMKAFLDLRWRFNAAYVGLEARQKQILALPKNDTLRSIFESLGGSLETTTAADRKLITEADENNLAEVDAYIDALHRVATTLYTALLVIGGTDIDDEVANAFGELAKEAKALKTQE